MDRRPFAELFLLALALIGATHGQVFVTQPESQAVPAQSTPTVIFPCRSDFTDPVYTWSRNGRQLDVIDSEKYELSIGDLFIKSPSQNDAGVYQCHVTGEEGVAFSNNANLTFQTFVTPMPTTQVQRLESQGRGVKLPCGKIDHSPEFSIYYMWENPDNFDRIPPQGVEGKYISQIDGTLYLANPQPEDGGKYECTAITIWKENGQKKVASANNFGLTIEDAVATYEPEFMVQPAEVTEVLLDGMTYIECFASGSPTPKITWTKNGSTELPASAQVSPSGQLAFIDAGRDVEGIYKCTAESSEGRISAQGRLTLKYAPRWVDEISSGSYDLDSPVTFSCAADASPSATYQWYKDNDVLDTTLYNIQSGAGYSRLSIATLSDSDSGIYQCVATNVVGSIISAAALEVRSYAPAIDPPVLSTTQAAFSHPTMIACHHTAAPAANIVWEKDGVAVNDSRFEILEDGSLRISTTMEEDTGLYACKLSNRLGSDESSGRLMVHDATEMTEKPQNQRAQAGENAALRCAATKDPSINLNWAWTHDQDVIDGFLDNHYFLNGGDLEIRNIASQHTGVYTCCAETTVNSPCASAQVFVTAPPDPPTKINIDRSTSDSQTVSWEAGFDNYSPITSYIVELRNSYSTEWAIAKTEPPTSNHTRRVVVNLLPHNDYIYRIYAVNEQGKSDPSESSAAFSTLKAAPAKAPHHVGGGGGNVGQLVVSWEPLHEEYYGSDDVDYVVAIQKANSENIHITFPVTLNNNSMPESKVVEDWEETVVYGGKSGDKTFTVGTDEVFAPYVVKVRARNDAGDGPWSHVTVVRTFEIAPNSAPATPRLESAKAYEAVLAWDVLVSETGRIDGYQVEITTAAGFDMVEQSLTTRGPAPTVRVEHLAANQVYSARVSGYNSAGQGPWSNSLKFTTTKKPPSKAPTGFQLSIVDHEIRGSWSPIVNDGTENVEEEMLQGYKVQYWRDGLSSDTAMTFVTMNSHYSFTLPRDGNFNVWVRGYNKGGDGPTSTIKYVSTKSVAPPGSLECCGAASVKFNGMIVLLVSLLWILFVKLDL